MRSPDLQPMFALHIIKPALPRPPAKIISGVDCDKCWVTKLQSAAIVHRPLAAKTKCASSRRQKNGAHACMRCKVMLLLVGGDEFIKSKFHHRHVQQVGGFDRDRLAALP